MSDIAELKALCGEWQQRLRLQDWKVTVAFARSRDIDDGYGRTRIRSNWKEADVQIAEDRVEDKQDVEQTLVHELLHLHFDRFTPSGGDSLVMFENGIDLTSWALVNAKREGRP